MRDEVLHAKNFPICKVQIFSKQSPHHFWATGTIYNFPITINAVRAMSWYHLVCEIFDHDILGQVMRANQISKFFPASPSSNFGLKSTSLVKIGKNKTLICHSTKVEHLTLCTSKFIVVVYQSFFASGMALSHNSTT